MTGEALQDSRFSSDLLESGAAGYAAAAANLLLERHPDTADRFGDAAFRNWKAHMAHRLRELSGALVVTEPRLFTADVAWSRGSFGAHDVPVEDLRASLECLRDSLASELPGRAAELTTSYLEAGIEASTALPTEPAPEASRSSESRLALRFLEAALSGKRHEAIELVCAAVGDRLSITAAYTEVLTVAQRMVGELWHQGDLSVAQEHFVTATVRDVMAVIAHQAKRSEPRDVGALVAVAPGNSHEIAARALADLLEIDGWNVIYAGGSLPASDLGVALRQFEAELLCLSIALSTQLRGAMESIATARLAKPGLKILLGGGVLLTSPDAWRRLGADAGAGSLEEAVEVASSLGATD